MIITEEELVQGLRDFLCNDVKPQVKDINLKMMVSAIGKIMEKSPDTVHKILDSDMVSLLLGKTDEGYDIDTAVEIISDVIDENGKITLTIPSIPLLYPNGGLLGLTKNDVDKLISRLQK